VRGRRSLDGIEQAWRTHEVDGIGSDEEAEFMDTKSSISFVVQDRSSNSEGNIMIIDAFSFSGPLSDTRRRLHDICTRRMIRVEYRFVAEAAAISSGQLRRV